MCAHFGQVPGLNLHLPTCPGGRGGRPEREGMGEKEEGEGLVLEREEEGRGWKEGVGGGAEGL